MKLQGYLTMGHPNLYMGYLGVQNSVLNFRVSDVHT